MYRKVCSNEDETRYKSVVRLSNSHSHLHIVCILVGVVTEYTNEEVLHIQIFKSLSIISLTVPLFGLHLTYVEDKNPVFCKIAKNVLKNSSCFLNTILFLQHCFVVCTSLKTFMA